MQEKSTRFLTHITY